jgi:hypothetical protein
LTDALALNGGLQWPPKNNPGGPVVSKAIFRFTLIVICSVIFIISGNRRAASAAPQNILPQSIHIGKLGTPISVNFFSNGAQASPEAVIAADFNKDGKLDVAILDSLPRVSVLSGLGSYQFGLILPANATAANPLSMAVGDFNGDGNLDLVTVGFGKISVLLGNGDLTFKPAMVQSIISTSFQKVAVGDFNKDGKLDIVVSDMDVAQSTIGVFLGNGDGTFSTSPIILNNGDLPNNVVVADFNNDGKLDIGVANAGDGVDPANVTIFLGDGTGGFSIQPLKPQVGVFPTFISAADINLDGNVDLIVGNSGNGKPGSASVLLGNGNGTFQPGTLNPIAAALQSLTVADFNDDGLQDFAAGDAAGNVNLFTNLSSATFSTPAPTATGFPAFAITSADLRGGGAADLLSATADGKTLLIFPNTGGSKVSYSTTPNPSAFQQSVAFTATVTPTAPNAPVPTGNLEFRDGISILGSVALSGTGSAAFSTAALAVGTHPTAAVYPGDPTFYSRASQPISQVVNKASTTTTATSSGNPEVVGDTVTFGIAVKPQFAGVPTGTVTLLDGSTSIGSSGLDAAGNANINVSNFTAGSHSITASYPGDANFTASASPMVNQSILASPDFTAAPPSSAPTVSVGQSVNTTITLTPIGNFTAPVTLACSGLPSLAQCAFNQPTYTLNRNVVTPVITISTVKGVITATPPSNFNLRLPQHTPATAVSELLAMILIAFASLSAFSSAKGNRKSLVRGAAFGALLLSISFVASCGSSPAPPPSTPTGTTNITITATAAGASGTVTHQATISLTVTP